MNTVSSHDEYVRYRFNRSEEAYDEALILSENGRWNAVVNRLYYSCFYAVIALLLKYGIKTQTHDGARTQFGLHFVKAGKIDVKQGKLFSKLSDYRQKGDYGDLYEFEQEQVLPLIKQTKDFIKEIGKLIG